MKNLMKSHKAAMMRIALVSLMDPHIVKGLFGVLIVLLSMKPNTYPLVFRS